MVETSRPYEHNRGTSSAIKVSALAALALASSLMSPNCNATREPPLADRLIELLDKEPDSALRRYVRDIAYAIGASDKNKWDFVYNYFSTSMPLADYYQASTAIDMDKGRFLFSIVNGVSSLARISDTGSICPAIVVDSENGQAVLRGFVTLKLEGQIAEKRSIFLSAMRERERVEATRYFEAFGAEDLSTLAPDSTQVSSGAIFGYRFFELTLDRIADQPNTFTVALRERIYDERGRVEFRTIASKNLHSA